MNSQFHLIPQSGTNKRAGWRRAWRAIGLVSMTAVLVVLTALYLPALWQVTPVAAGPVQVRTGAQPMQMDASLVGDQEALADLYTRVAASVVSIQVTQPATQQLLPGFPGNGAPEQGLPEAQAQGSGFIYDSEGHIVTNNHVVDGATSVVVVFDNGAWADAEVVATDPQADLAVIKVTPPDGFEWKPLKLEAANTLRVGHMVIAIGNPFGLESTMTTGIVSALGRSFPVGGFGENRYTLPDVIQTDAAINPGNSGGPLLDLNGNVVGVNFAIESPVRSNSGVGFAIPVSIVERVVPALIADGRYSYPYLGISGASITPELAKQLELSNSLVGAYVATVLPGGPADKAGLLGADSDTGKGGDIIVAFNDQPVASFDELVAHLVTQTKPGDQVVLKVLRDGKEQSVDLTVGERPANAQTRVSGKGGQDGQGDLTARQAIRVAEEAARDLLNGEITDRIATPDERDGKPVWVVELSTAEKTATVVVDRATGEVIEASVK